MQVATAAAKVLMTYIERLARRLLCGRRLARMGPEPEAPMDTAMEVIQEHMDSHKGCASCTMMVLEQCIAVRRGST